MYIAHTLPQNCFGASVDRPIPGECCITSNSSDQVGEVKLGEVKLGDLVETIPWMCANERKREREEGKRERGKEGGKEGEREQERGWKERREGAMEGREEERKGGWKSERRSEKCSSYVSHVYRCDIIREDQNEDIHMDSSLGVPGSSTLQTAMNE